MSDTLIQWSALFGVLAIGTMFVLEVRRWHSLTSVIGRRQRRVRVALFVLIEALFAMMFAGPMVIGKNPLDALLYYTICTLIGLAVLVLALVDLSAVMRGYESLNRRMFGCTRDDDRRDK